MVFQDKLVFLMELTSTSNKKLAEAIRVDASLVSRFRSGNRNLPKNAEYIGAMANYFASRCKTKYQIEALSEIVGRASLTRATDIEKISEVLTSWLFSDSTIHQSQADLFLHAFDRLKKTELEEPPKEDVVTKINLKGSEVYSFNGNDGKRRANLMFEQLVLSSKSVGEIKILTEGNTDWLWNDKEYAREVSNNIKKAIFRGSTITRIVPQMNNLAMAFDSVTRWLPLYMTGRVKSYYYPNIRDKIFCRTLYVAPGIAAMISTTIGEQSECGTTFLITDPFTVASFDREYRDYLVLCRPATTIYEEQSSTLKFRNCIRKFWEHDSNCITILSSLSFISTPPEYFMKLIKDFDAEELHKDYNICFANFEHLVAHQYYKEVFYLESFEDIIAGKARCVTLEALQEKNAYYTPDEYRLHLINIVNMLYEYPNYHVVLSKESDLVSNVCVNQNNWLMLYKAIPQKAICVTEYADIVSAVWEYALSKTQTDITDAVNRIEAISKIKQLIRQLSNYTYCRDVIE